MNCVSFNYGVMFHTTPHIHLTRHAGVWRDVLFRLFPIVSLLFAFASSAYGGHGAAWSSDGEIVALTVTYGAPKALMTSVWTMESPLIAAFSPRRPRIFTEI